MKKVEDIKKQVIKCYIKIFIEADFISSKSATVRFLFLAFLFCLLIRKFNVVISPKLSSFVFQNSVYEIVKCGDSFFVVFRGCFTVIYPNFICYLLGFLVIYLPLTLQVNFVTHQHHFNFVNICFFVELVYPKINCIKCACLCNVENQQHSVYVSIINWCDCSETLMACCIPQLYFYRFVII